MRRHPTTNARLHRIIILSVLILVIGPSASRADTGVEWGKRALKIQNQIDFATPFHNTFWVGTHNSFNARDWGYTTDPNQKRKPQDQLESGAIELTYDIYWSAGEMKLCHGACGASDKTFRKGLDEIRDFLDEHPEAVVMLKLEVTGSAIDGKWSKLENQLEGAIGARIYTPEIAGLSTGCQTLNPSSITKQEILERGKNLIVIVTPEPKHGCPSDNGWNKLVFTGFKLVDTSISPQTTKTAYKFTHPKDAADCKTKKEDGVWDMQRVHDGRTWNGVGSGDDVNALTPSSYEGYMQAGLNIFELFNFNGEGSNTKYPFLKPQDLVWSFRSSEPSGDGDCAVAEHDGRFNDVSCDGQRYFACLNQTTNTWKIAIEKQPFASGNSVCSRYGGTFAVPVNPYEADKLKTELAKLSPDIDVWVNYQDLSIEGQWVANSSDRLPYVRVDAAGGSGGGAFDDFGQMKVDLYRRTPRRVTAVILRSGARVDAVGLTYSDGKTISHGGSGGSERTLSLAANERVITYERCYKKHNGKDRIFYLKLVTDKGNTLSGGEHTGTCSSGTYSDEHLFGFIGRSGENVDALGFYFRGP